MCRTFFVWGEYKYRKIDFTGIEKYDPETVACYHDDNREFSWAIVKLRSVDVILPLDLPTDDDSKYDYYVVVTDTLEDMIADISFNSSKEACHFLEILVKTNRQLKIDQVLL